MIPAEDFFEFNPLSAGISRVFDPASRESFQNPICQGGFGFFLEQPNNINRLFIDKQVILYMSLFYLLTLKFSTKQIDKLGQISSLKK